jgi:hypothetical protein
MSRTAGESYHTTQARAQADRQRRGVKVCTCGAEYTPGVDGRQIHRVLHGHAPTAQGEHR